MRKSSLTCGDPAGVGVFVLMAVLLCHLPLASAGTINLGTAGSFAVLGASTVTNTGSSTISGSVGVYPGSSITGFPPGVVSDGVIDADDAVAQQALADEAVAYAALKALTLTDDETGTDLAGLTLTPGVYTFSSGAALNGTLTLDFEGLSNALFVFQIGTTLITGSGASVNVINGGDGDGIFWEVGSSTTLGSGTTFAGNILSMASVTLDTGATVECGRVFAETGAVTLDTNVISNNCSVNDFGSGRTDFGSLGFSGTTPAVPESAVPEPGSISLWLGLAALAFYGWHTRRRPARSRA